MQAGWIVALWVLFAATHMGLSSLRWRPRLVARLGERGFQGVYSLVALAIFVPLVSTYYANKHAGAYLWGLAQFPVVRWIGYGLAGAAFALVVAGFAQPSPAGMVPGSSAVRGVARITRHPVLMGFGLWGLAHLLLLPRVHASDLAFFAGFAVFAFVGCDHQDRRKLATNPAYRAFHDATPFVPFSSPGFVRGLVELPLPVAAAAGIALAWAARTWAHAWLAGGS
jgi:uncharacterized membrane protein